jgi:hypothetical protein
MGDVSATQQNLPSGMTVLGLDESAGHDDILDSDRYWEESLVGREECDRERVRKRKVKEEGWG